MCFTYCGQGRISRPAEPHIKTGYCTYRVEGKAVDGVPMAIVIVLMSELQIDLVTVFPKDA